jgi:ribosomal protein S18 acetylase RimI-like enzyme
MMPPEADRSGPVGTVWVMDLDGPLSRATAAPSATLGRAGSEAAGELAAAMGSAGPAECLRRFARGCRCHVAWVDGRLASYGWISFVEEMAGEVGLRIRLLPGEAYIWDCATVPSFQRRGLYTALLTDMAAALRAEGLCRVWIGADLANAPSQAGMARAGFRAVADLAFRWGSPFRPVEIRPREGVPEALLAEMRRVFLGPGD